MGIHSELSHLLYSCASHEGTKDQFLDEPCCGQHCGPESDASRPYFVRPSLRGAHLADKRPLEKQRELVATESANWNDAWGHGPGAWSNQLLKRGIVPRKQSKANSPSSLSCSSASRDVRCLGSRPWKRIG